MMNVTVQMVVYCVILVLLAIPLGSYMGKVMNGEHVFLSGVLQPVERVIYRVLKIDPEEDMDWKKYSVCAGVFSVEPVCPVGHPLLPEVPSAESGRD